MHHKWPWFKIKRKNILQNQIHTEMKLGLYETEYEYINTFKEIKEGLDSTVKEEEINKLD